MVNLHKLTYASAHGRKTVRVLEDAAQRYWMAEAVQEWYAPFQTVGSAPAYCRPWIHSIQPGKNRVYSTRNFIIRCRCLSFAADSRRDRYCIRILCIRRRPWVDGGIPVFARHYWRIYRYHDAGHDVRVIPGVDVIVTGTGNNLNHRLQTKIFGKIEGLFKSPDVKFTVEFWDR